MKVEAGFEGGVYWVKLGNDTPIEFTDFMSAKIVIDNYVDGMYGLVNYPDKSVSVSMAHCQNKIDGVIKTAGGVGMVPERVRVEIRHLVTLLQSIVVLTRKATMAPRPEPLSQLHGKICMNVKHPSGKLMNPDQIEGCGVGIRYTLEYLAQSKVWPVSVPVDAEQQLAEAHGLLSEMG